VSRFRPASHLLPLLGPLLLAAVLSACAGPVPQRPDGSAALLEELIAEYVSEQGQTDGRDPIFTAAYFANDIERQRDLLNRLQLIGTGGLSMEQDTDRRFLVGLLETDIRSAETSRRWENDPAMYVPSRRIGALMDPDAPEPVEQRVNELISLLDSLPSRLSQAQENLQNPPRRFTEAAIFQVQASLATMQGAESEFSDTQAAAALRKGINALEGYLSFMKTALLSRSSGEWAIGSEAYDYILQHRWFMTSNADDILERGLRAFRETEVLAQEVAERIQAGKHWTEVYESLKDDHPAAADIKQAYQHQMDLAGRFVREHRIVSLPEGERVITLDTPPAMRRSSPFGTFQSVAPFDDGLEGRLMLTPIEDWMTGEQQADRLRSHHNAWIPIIAVHEAYPGHHVHALKTRENPRLLRKIAREPIFSEGWGLFTEELMFELGFLKSDAVRLTQLRNRLWRAARVILDSSLHTGRMSFEEAVDFLVKKVRFEPYSAELEVGMYIRRPTYVLGYLIGMQELMAIRQDYVRMYGDPEPPSVFYDQLLGIGSIPPALAREELLRESGR
jgi:uncharacterized protein (DUF885 family)